MKLARQLLDILFPPRCPICQNFLWNDPLWSENRGRCFCQECFSGFQEIRPPLCPSCGRPFALETGEDHFCEACLRKRPLYEAAAAPYRYEATLMDAIHQFKYVPKGHLGDILGPLLAEFAARRFDGNDDFLIVPVPLHPKRLRERGFNQSLLLARHVAKPWDADLDWFSLRRRKYTLPQTGLGKEERRKNVRGAFEVTDSKGMKGRTALLVDDVATTGSTLNECSGVLMKAGCEKVFCLTLAMTPNM